MKTLLRPIVALLALFLLAPSSRAGSPTDDRPHGWLGILVGERAASTQAGDATEPSGMQGVLVRGIVDGSPAQQARLRAKDTIVAVDGALVTTGGELMTRLRDLEPGTLVTLSVRRGGHDLELSTTVSTRPTDTERMKLIVGWLGVEAIELPASLRTRFGAPDDAGIMISRVVEGSPAEDSGIRVGDVVYEADGMPVDSLASLSRIVREAGIDNQIDVALARDGARIVVGPQIARAPERPVVDPD